MRDQHMNPAEAVQAFIDCGAELAFGHHYGTFQLTDEADRRAADCARRSLKGRWNFARAILTLLPGQVWQL